MLTTLIALALALQTLSASIAQASETIPAPVTEPRPAPSTEEAVRAYFSDIPIMAEIAGCESGFRQFDAAGQVLRGKVNPRDTGVFQINLDYHAHEAQRLGTDLSALDGNLRFARYLYESKGTGPWGASKSCWQPRMLR